MVADNKQLQNIKAERADLLDLKENLTRKLTDVEKRLTVLDNLEKPYVACVQSYSGGGKAAFKTLEQAEKKLEEYRGKKYFRNGLNYGVYLYKHLEDGSKEMLKVIPLQEHHFREPDLSRI